MVANDTPSSPTFSIENMGSPLSSNADDPSPIEHERQDAAAAITVTPPQGNSSTSLTSYSSTALPSQHAPGNHVHSTFVDNMDVDMDFTPVTLQCASTENAAHLQESEDTATQLTREMIAASAKLPTPYTVTLDKLPCKKFKTLP